MVKNKDKLIVILGPTATGKTKISLDIAKLINSEIISTDSMQIYKEMNIGTAKIEPDLRKKIKHHMIDIVEPNEEFTVYDFQNRAVDIINDLKKDNKIPILVGGSGLYINSILYDLNFKKVPSDENIRKELYNIEKNDGKEKLYSILKDLDVEATEKIHPNNVKRVIRAIEVYKLTGEKYSKNKNFRKYSDKYDFIIIGLEMNRKLLYNRINLRVDEMIKEGLFQEVKKLYNKGYDKSYTSMQAIGYKEVIEYLEGNISKDEAIRLIKRNTRRFAKRQITWFKPDERIKWFNIDQYDDDYSNILNNIILYINERGLQIETKY